MTVIVFAVGTQLPVICYGIVMQEILLELVMVLHNWLDSTAICKTLGAMTTTMPFLL
jgi:hypothetical protein